MDDNRTNPNIQNKTGDTALILSIKSYLTIISIRDLVKILLKDLSIKINIDGYTEYSSNLGNIQLVNRSGKKVGNKPDYPLDVNIKNKYSSTALMYAINLFNQKNRSITASEEKYITEIIELLVAKGANARLENNNLQNSLEFFDDLIIHKKIKISEELYQIIKNILETSINYYE